MNQTSLAVWRTEFAPEIVGESPGILEVLDTIRQVAGSGCNLLITGETGTGKELFARVAHRSSSRRSQPFIPVNCAAIPETLLETELFGHVKGAFTGATHARVGRFLSANGGTIFLDEIGDLPLAAQAKLLRVLEERVVCSVGSDTEVPVDVRVVAATHRNLQDMVDQGAFRADLYFRLAVVPVHLPPLRERADDVCRLAELCLARASERLGRNIEGFDDSALEALLEYTWPGNVREMGHLIERSVLLTRQSRLSAADLPLPVAFASGTNVTTAIPDADGRDTEDPSLDLRSALENLERRLIRRALEQSGGNRTEAAALLGLNRTTLVEKLRKYAA